MQSPNEFLSPSSARRENNAVIMVATAPRFFSEDECRKLLDLSEQQAQITGTVGDNLERSPARNSRVKFLMPDNSTEWIFRKLNAAIRRLNEAYQYQLSGFEALQVATYSVDDHYDWHIDLGPGKNSTRKLSLSLQLSDSSEYEGGDLEFMNVGQMTSREIGTLITFPAFLMHRVTPVTRGTRKSLVAWISGDPFR
jgi:PKHD-type hydroxylase